jgi:non-specific protein-tyrosine kinase
MEIRDFFGILWRRKLVILTTLVTAVAIAALLSFLTKPVYSAFATIRILSGPSLLSDNSNVNVTQAERTLNTYSIIATSKTILESVIKTLNLKTDDRKLRNAVKVLAVKDTELIQLEVEDGDPAQAAAIANGIARALIEDQQNSAAGQTTSDAIQTQLNQIQKELADLRAKYDDLLTNSPDQTAQITEVGRAAAVKQQIQETLLAQFDQARLREALARNTIILIDPAEEPTNPSRPRRTLNIAIGTVLGLIGGVAVALVLENLDQRLFNLGQVQRLVDLPILGAIPFSNQKTRWRANTHMIELREAYRRLRTNLFALQNEGNSLKTILVTSAEDGDGKSSVVFNLAHSIAQLRMTVLIVDCDLRQPSQHRLFNLPNEVGLGSVLRKLTPLKDAIQATNTPSLSVLTSGPVPNNPTELLSLDYMNVVLQEAASRYDIVLLDSPALVPVIDAAALAPLVDGVLQVVRSGSSHGNSVLATFEQITEVRARPIGLVINNAPHTISTYYSNHIRQNLA